jgi:hypothetical protein
MGSRGDKGVKRIVAACSLLDRAESTDPATASPR